MTDNDKTQNDRQLLARVLEDARLARERSGLSLHMVRDELLLKHRQLFSQWEELTGGRRLVAYFARLDSPMESSDIAPITALLDRRDQIENLDLLIYSPGGSAQTAEKVVAACRQVCEGEFRVAVPNMAKSAATMVALGADQILMGYLSELGPIDPQVPVKVGGFTRPVSAQSFLDGQATMLKSIEEAQEKDASLIGYLQLLNAPEMSPAWIAEMRREIKFGQDLVAKLLKTHMLPRINRDLDARQLGAKASRIARDLSQANKRFNHGRMIGAQECRDQLGLDVQILDRDDPLWKLMWEIWVRMEIYLQTYPAEDAEPSKIFADADEVQLSG
jgi:serine dehydrogenase proteinase